MDISRIAYNFLLTPGCTLTIVFIIVVIFPLSSNVMVKLFHLLGCRVASSSDTPSYGLLSSLLMNSLIFIPLGIFVWSVENLIPYELIYDYVVLLFCLEFSSVKNYILGTSNALRNNNKNLARKILHPFVLRDVSCLSEMGIAKATIESIPLNFLTGWFVPAFWFLVCGARGALLSTFIVILGKAFNLKLPQFKQFGKINSFLYKTVILIPSLFMVLFMNLGSDSIQGSKYATKTAAFHPYPISGFIISFLAGSLNISLGGPRIYEEQKVRFARLGSVTDPAPVHIEKAYRKLRNSVLVSLLFVVIGQFVWCL